MGRAWWLMMGILAACSRPQRPRLDAWPVVQASVAGAPLAWHVAISAEASRDQGMVLYGLEPSGGEWCGEDFGASALACFKLDGLSLQELRALDAGTWSAHSTLFLAARADESIPSELGAELVALDRLVAGSCRLGETGGELQRVVGPLPEQTDLTRWAAQRAADDTLYERLCHLTPLDECGLQGTSALALELLAELAVARRDRATLVATELELIALAFPRATPFSAARLNALGVDPERFFTGALLQAPTQRAPRVPARKLGRAIREAGLVELMGPQLERLATRADLDTWNRFRAALAWEEAQPEAVTPRALALHPLARAFLQRSR